MDFNSPAFKSEEYSRTLRFCPCYIFFLWMLYSLVESSRERNGVLQSASRQRKKELLDNAFQKMQLLVRQTALWSSAGAPNGSRIHFGNKRRVVVLGGEKSSGVINVFSDNPRNFPRY